MRSISSASAACAWRTMKSFTPPVLDNQMTENAMCFSSLVVPEKPRGPDTPPAALALPGYRQSIPSQESFREVYPPESQNEAPRELHGGPEKERPVLGPRGGRIGARPFIRAHVFDLLSRMPLEVTDVTERKVAPPDAAPLLPLITEKGGVRGGARESDIGGAPPDVPGDAAVGLRGDAGGAFVDRVLLGAASARGDDAGVDADFLRVREERRDLRSSPRRELAEVGGHALTRP